MSINISEIDQGCCFKVVLEHLVFIIEIKIVSLNFSYF